MKSFSASLKGQLIDHLIPSIVKQLDPGALLRKRIHLSKGRFFWEGGSYLPRSDRSVYVVGAGKGAARMAAAVEELFGEALTAGVVVTKYGYGLPSKKVRVLEAGHPIPDRSGERGAQELLAVARRCHEGDLLIGLWSGGASALLPLPLPGITLFQKKRVTDLLLKSGATIAEINAVRKHLSQIKGGRLAAAASAAVMVNFILSDVVGDRLDVIGSGPMVPDSSRFYDSVEVLKRYHLWVRAGESIRKVLEQGEGGIVKETPKRDDPLWRHVSHVLIGNGELAVKAAAGQLRAIGYRPKIFTSSLVGEAKEVAKVWAALAKEEQRKKRSDRPVCLLAGGETTVTVRGAGWGGRCQEFALSAAISISGMDGMTVAAFSTDGTDGPTDAAGAIADGETLRRAERKGLDARRFLNENNSHVFFESLGGLLRTGPTRNQLNDLYFAFIR